MRMLGMWHGGRSMHVLHVERGARGMCMFHLVVVCAVCMCSMQTVEHGLCTCHTRILECTVCMCDTRCV